MSKKFFLKRTYAEVVKGQDNEDNQDQFSYEDLEDFAESRNEDFEDFAEGISVIKTRYTGFGYHDLNKASRDQHIKVNLRRSPRKKAKVNYKVSRSMPVKLEPELNFDDVIIIRDSPSPDPIETVSSDTEIAKCHDSDGSASLPDPWEATPIADGEDHDNNICGPVFKRSPRSCKTKEAKKQLSFESSKSPSELSDHSLSSFSPISQKSKTKDEKGYYHDDPLIPVFANFKDGVKTKDVVEILLNAAENNNMAKSIPNYIDQNVAFIYSVKDIGHWKNCLCDGMGVWSQMGTEAKYIEVEASGKFTFVSEHCDTSTLLKVSRRKYVNKSNTHLHRVVIHMADPRTNEAFNEMFVQYYFDQTPGASHTQSKVQPHGNTKREYKPYQRTSHSTYQRIKQFRMNNIKPKDIFNDILLEQGGLEKVKGSSFIPRNRKQIYNVNEKAKFTDPVVECTDLAKEQEKNLSKFVRDVRTAPEFTMFLASDRQLSDIEKFCTQNKNFCVLGADTTFNIGNYYVTVTVYRNQMLLNKFDSEPVMLGPMLIHQRKTFDSYFKLPSTLLQECPKLVDLKVFGTDGDVNLSSAFQACFPMSKHLLCDIHMFDNMDRKLTKLGISGKIKKQYLNDIFGSVEGDIKVQGLVDSLSPEDFSTSLDTLSEKWKDMHLKGADFFDYFVEYKADIIRNSMSTELRSLCGLGFPPKTYTQNPNECINKVIKDGLPTKCDPYDFAKKMEERVKQQENEIKLAIIGKGEYRLKPEYSHLQVDENLYWRKTATQRRAVFKKFLQAPLSTRVSSDEETEQTNVLSMSASQSHIDNIPYRVLIDIFNDASNVMMRNGSIIKAPGCSDTFYVADYKSKKPREVSMNMTTFNIKCEKNCFRFNSYSICEHTISLAEFNGVLKEYIEKFKQKGNKLNIMKVSNFGLSNKRGKKATAATQKRKGKANNPAVEVTEYKQNNLLTADASENSMHLQPFHLTFLAGIIKKCYGCGQTFSDRQRNAPNDLVLKRYDHRIYCSPRSKTMKQSAGLQNTYFHLNADCARKKAPNFEFKDVIIHTEIKRNLSSEHQALLEAIGIPL